MYCDPITRQTFKYATPKSCLENPQKVRALDPDNDEHFVLTPEPVFRATPTLFEQKQTQSTVGFKTFTTQ